MQLNQEQQKKLIEKLNELWQQPKTCPICGNDAWEASDVIFELREFHGGGMVIGNQSMITPVVSVICRKCGYAFFVNAIKLDIIKKDGAGTETTEGK